MRLCVCMCLFQRHLLHSSRLYYQSRCCSPHIHGSIFVIIFSIMSRFVCSLEYSFVPLIHIPFTTWSCNCRSYCAYASTNIIHCDTHGTAPLFHSEKCLDLSFEVKYITFSSCYLVLRLFGVS